MNILKYDIRHSSSKITLYVLMLEHYNRKEELTFYSRLRSNTCLKSPLDSYDAPSFGMLRVKAEKKKLKKKEMPESEEDKNSNKND